MAFWSLRANATQSPPRQQHWTTRAVVHMNSQLYRVHEQPVVNPGTFRLRTSTQCPRKVSMLKFAIRGFSVFAIAAYVGQWAGASMLSAEQDTSNIAAAVTLAGCVRQEPTARTPICTPGIDGRSEL